jgi:hypothetical protein
MVAAAKAALKVAISSIANAAYSFSDRVFIPFCSPSDNLLMYGAFAGVALTRTVRAWFVVNNRTAYKLQHQRKRE